MLSRGLHQAQMGLRTGGPQVAPQSEPFPQAWTSAPQGLSQDTACRAPGGLAWARSSSRPCALQTPVLGPQAAVAESKLTLPAARQAKEPETRC